MPVYQAGFSVNHISALDLLCLQAFYERVSMGTLLEAVLSRVLLLSQQQIFRE